MRVIKLIPQRLIGVISRQSYDGACCQLFFLLTTDGTRAVVPRTIAHSGLQGQPFLVKV